MGGNTKISKSKAMLLIVLTAILGITATAYIYNYFYEKQIVELVLATNIAEARKNVWLARKLRTDETEKTIQVLDSNTGGDAILFTDYRQYAPENLHEDIRETLQTIKAYREEFAIKSSEEELQRDIDKALAQVK